MMSTCCIRRRASPWIAAAIGLAGAAAGAATQFHHGSLSTDDQIVQIGVDLASDELFSVISLSWGGGISATGAVVAGGGFAPVLALFDGGGQLVQIDHGGGGHACGAAGSGAPDAVLGFCWDAGFKAPLLAGHYTLVLSQDGNEPGATLADAYSMAGLPDYTTVYLPGARGFVDVNSVQRDGHWALDLSATSLPVPEPATGLLWAAGLAWLLLRRHAAA
jgi:hypothetical protein